VVVVGGSLGGLSHQRVPSFPALSRTIEGLTFNHAQSALTSQLHFHGTADLRRQKRGAGNTEGATKIHKSK
jgi:hypothetical protein